MEGKRRRWAARWNLTGEGGNASLVILGGVAMTMVLIVGIGDIAIYLLARTRAQTAADGAALAAAAELIPGLGTAPEAKAQQFARANGARLVACECALGSTTAEISVSVPVRFSMAALVGVTEVSARSRSEISVAGPGP